MGKLGVVGLTVAAVVLGALLPSREAGAQDFGQTWIDRITHELERERGPLEAKPVTWSVDAGVEYAFGKNWAMELAGNIQFVRFQDKTFNSEENNNFTVDFTVVYRTPWAFDLLAQVGYLNISYIEDQASGGTPDAFGYYYRGGFRGHVI